MSRKGHRSGNLNKALEQVSAYVSHLAGSLSEESTMPPPDQPWMSFSRGEAGGLQLSGDEVRQYHDCLDALIEASDPEIVSRRAIDGYLKDIIMASLDVNNKRPDTTLEQRLKESLTEFRITLAATPRSWKVYFRVSGMKPTFNPSSFGRIDFVVFDEHHFDDYKETIKRTFKELQLTLDIINFYSDILHPPRSAYVSIYGQDERLLESMPVYIPGDEPVLLQSQHLVGRLQDLSMSELVHGKGSKIGSNQISSLLLKKNRNAIEERLISAMQWAGRATADERNEEAFLLYAIALECLIMERGNEPELGYRLRMRVAHLLGSDLPIRKNIRNTVNRLYSIRSAIVHKGEYLVTESDLKLMRHFAKESIVRMLLEEPFRLMEKDEDLIGWFDERLLE